jgi:ribonuclease Z
MEFEFLTLGCRAAFPSKNAITSAHVLRVKNDYFLLDCAEATQMKLALFKIPQNKIRAIFITHLHGDHFFGLPGLLSSFGHHHRTSSIQIIGPKDLKHFVENVISLTSMHLGFNVEYTELNDETGEILLADNLWIHYKKLAHRINTYGYTFREKPHLVNLNPELLRKHKFSFESIQKLRNGESAVTEDGLLISCDDVAAGRKKQRSLAYITDTAYDPQLIDFVRDIDLLYHETTYLDDLADEAEKRSHSTCGQAATIAKEANARNLIMGHFSSRYADTSIFEREARKIFNAAFCTAEGMKFSLEPVKATLSVHNHMSQS